MKVLLTNEMPPEHRQPLEELAELLMGPGGGDMMPREEVLAHAPEVDAIINQGELRVDAELLDAAPRLKIVANVAMGTNNLNLALMQERGVVATNAPDAFTDSTADCTLALLLCLVRRVHEADAFVRSGKWLQFRPGPWDGMELRGKRIGIVGYGRIGRAVAERARAFGMEVVAFSRSSEGLPEYRPLRELLAVSDVVALHVPLTEETRRLIGAEELACMKDGAILVNMARGAVVDEAELVKALKSGHLGGAALDVFEDEPRVHPELPTLSNVVLAPHIGGGTREARQRARLLAAENVARVLRGQPPLTPVVPT